MVTNSASGRSRPGNEDTRIGVGDLVVDHPAIAVDDEETPAARVAIGRTDDDERRWCTGRESDAKNLGCREVAERDLDSKRAVQGEAANGISGDDQQSLAGVIGCRRHAGLTQRKRAEQLAGIAADDRANAVLDPDDPGRVAVRAREKRRQIGELRRLPPPLSSSGIESGDSFR